MSKNKKTRVKDVAECASGTVVWHKTGHRRGRRHKNTFGIFQFERIVQISARRVEAWRRARPSMPIWLRTDNPASKETWHEWAEQVVSKKAWQL